MLHTLVPPRAPRTDNPWPALWALLIGFFMILLDATIVAVANPAIMDHFDADYEGTIWVTSAYLLAYAVPLLLAGRLGDRFGPKNLYLVGLAVFTVSSLWCGLSGSIEMLVAARVLQGIGAALLTPQTLSTITRIFPPERRGVALSIWGATAGVATLVGPLAGGVLVDGLGWQWIFIVNVPIGLVGLVLAYVFVPSLPVAKHGFDVIGVALSGIGMFLIVFALQEGQSHDWAGWIWGMIVVGFAVLGGFVYWQAVNPGEPLIPLKIFRDNDFSLSNLGIAVIGFTATAMVLPVFFYAQAVCGLSPTRAALLTSPMAIATGVLAPFVGRLVDRSHPRPIVGFGFSVLAIALTWLSFEMTATTPIWRLVLPFLAIGIGMAFIWSPLAATATRGLPPQLAGAGSGVYNAMRQVGSVLGSAGMAAFMTSRISAEMPGDPGRPTGAPVSITQLPEFLQAPYSAALSEALLLPAFVSLFGVIAALFLRGADGPDGFTVAARPVGPAGRVARPPVEPDYFHDDDEYVEYAVEWDDQKWDEPETNRPAPVGRYDDFVPDALVPDEIAADESRTEPLAVQVSHPLPGPAETWHGDRVDTWHSPVVDDEPMRARADTVPELISNPDVVPVPGENGRRPWRSILDEMLDASPTPTAKLESERNGFAHNGFHVTDDEPLRVSAPPVRRAGRHSRTDDRGDDTGTHGRHSIPFRD